MKRKSTIAAILLTAAMTAGLMSGCGSKEADTAKTTGTTETAAAEQKEGEIKEFTAFFAVPGTEINSDNVNMNEIAKKIGAKCKETWLTGQTAEEAIGTLIAGGEYPDFVCASTGQSEMLDAGAFIALDEYWDNYPNVKNYLTEAQWNQVRSDDGHIYTMPQFGIINDRDTETLHNDEAFWIQTRVLKWGDYPKITTVDQYFDLIGSYLEANPTMADGTKNIGFEICSDDWRYFALENPPLFLDGSPNDGCGIVDPETLKVTDYNTTETAKKYFAKLNEEYKKGVIDPETFTSSYDQYIAKISTGRVLGMVDQHWNFQPAEDAIKQQKLNDSTYVPLGIVMEEGTKARYHNLPPLDVSNGLGITTSCQDIEGAMKFLNDLLSQEISTMRFWGVQGIDYEVGEDGVFHRTPEQREKAVNQEYLVSTLCKYSYFPHFEGMNLDGINAWEPARQPGEFYEALPAEVQECLAAYGAKTYVEMLNTAEENSPWFPLWSFSNAFTADTAHGMAKVNMDEVKHEYLPKVIMTSDFEKGWSEYMSIYKERVDVDAYIKALETEVARRIAVAQE